MVICRIFALTLFSIYGWLLLGDWDKVVPSRVTTHVSPDMLQERGPFLVILLPAPELFDGVGVDGTGVTEGLGVGVADCEGTGVDVGLGVAVGAGEGAGVCDGAGFPFDAPLIVSTSALPSCEGARV